jgi:hypothetical protein
MLVALRRSLGGRLLLEPSLRYRACTRSIHIHIAPRKPAIAQLDVSEDLASLQSTVQQSPQSGETIPKSDPSRSSKSKMAKAVLARQSTSSQQLRSKEKQSSGHLESKMEAERGKAGHARKANQPLMGKAAQSATDMASIWEGEVDTPQHQRPSSLRKPGETSPSTRFTGTSNKAGKKVKEISHSTSTSHKEPNPKKSSPEIESTSKEDIVATAIRLDSPYKWDEETIYSLYLIPSEDQFPSVIRKHSNATKSEKVFDWKADPMYFLQDGLKLNCKREVAILNKGNRKLSPSYRARLTVNYCKDVCKAIGDGPSQVMSS